MYKDKFHNCVLLYTEFVPLLRYMHKTWEDVNISLTLYSVHTRFSRVTHCYANNAILVHKPIRYIEFYFFWLSFRIGRWNIKYLFYRANEHTNFLDEFMLKIIDIGTPHNYTMWFRAEHEITEEVTFGIF